jgi:hypothetical protein
MPVTTAWHRLGLRAREQHGFTMIIALGVMLVTSLLLVAVFTAVNGDINNSHENVLHQQAYYAALSGVQEYEYKLEANNSYWQNCEPLVSNEEGGERYEVRLLPAEGQSACSAANPFETEIEKTGVAANTFRIVSVGCAGSSTLSSCTGQKVSNVSTRSIVATFKLTGFLDYVFFTQYEDIDPALNGTNVTNCTKYYEEKGVKRAKECETLIFQPADSVNGPMHTDDAANVTCSKELNFGRETQKTPPDTVEINGGTWPTCTAGTEPTYYTESKTYSRGTELVPPESDESLGAYVESANKFSGVTELTLNGTTNEILVANWKGKVKTETKIAWPKNGLIYVENNGACTYEYKVEGSDTSSELGEEEKCGTVYVEGTYSKSLTVAGANDVVVNGNIYPTSVAGKLGSAPTGTQSLGLIATNFVRVYHPCTTGGFGSGNQTGSLTNPWIYAAILSTDHSFTVDNYKCGATLGNLDVYGAIAQKFRGPVGQVGSHGYAKEYKYDQRLASSEPPYYLSPLKTGWKVSRETTRACSNKEGLTAC